MKFILDGTKITDKKTLLEELAKVCTFPDYFGHNWDALNDCLGEIALYHPAGSIQIIWDTRGISTHPDSIAIIAMMQIICDRQRINLMRQHEFRTIP